MRARAPPHVQSQEKHHWQVAGATFMALHLMFDKHAEQLTGVVDGIAERIQTLGGIAIAMAADVAELTRIEKPPRGREEVPVQISRLLEAHEHILIETRRFEREAAERGDAGTNDYLVSEVIRLNETQAWFVSEHVVDTPLVRAR
jgi:starvation-inducible DNA-binding protein